MEILAIVLGCIAFLGCGVHSQSCANITMDSCTIPEGKIITSVTSPTPDNCQQFCQIYKSCHTWVFRTIIDNTENCDLLAMNIEELLGQCQEVGSYRTVSFEDCIDPTSVSHCEGFSQGGCSFTGEILETLPGVVDRQTCALSAELRNAEYWMYNVETDDCVLYGINNFDRTCNTARGPNNGQGNC